MTTTPDIVPVQPFPYSLPPLSNITPFTYPDGVTYLEILRSMQRFLNETLIPAFNANIAQALAEFQSGVANAEQTIAAYQAATDKAIADFKAATQTTLDGYSADVAATKADWTSQFNAFMADIQNQIDTMAANAAGTAVDNYLATTTYRLPPPSGADDTAAIQAVINRAAANGGGTVLGRRGVVYSVTKAGTRNVALPSGTTGAMGYALTVPSGITVDLDGATLRMTGGTDYSAVVNATMDGHDTAVGLVNGTIDANSIPQTGAGGLSFVGVRGLTLRDLTVKNAVRVGIQTWDIDRARYDRLTVANTTGNGYVLGQPQAGKYETNGLYGALVADGTVAFPDNVTNFPGNSIYLVMQNAVIASITALNCIAGVKVGDPTQYVEIGDVFVTNPGDGTGNGNSGIKFQGSSSTSKVRKVNVRSIGSYNCSGTGLYIDQYSEEITIGQYKGDNNGVIGGWPDAWLGGPRFKIGALDIANAGNQGVLVRDSATDYQIGEARIRNIGKLSGSASSSSIGYSQTAGNGTVGDLSVMDDQATRTLYRAVSLTGGTLSISKARCVGQADTPFALYNTAQGWVGSPVVSAAYPATDSPFGQATPAAGATSTNIANANFVAFGANITPVVELEAMEGSARNLTGLYWTFTAGNLKLNHSAAVGTEKIRWRLVGYVTNQGSKA